MTNEIHIPGTAVDVGKITSFLESLYGIPKVGLVLIFGMCVCLWIHFVVKKLPFIPNYVAPVAIPCMVPFICPIMLVLCQSWQDSKIAGFWNFIFINVMIGFICGTASTLVYYFAMLPAIRKFKPSTSDTDILLKSQSVPDEHPKP